MNQLKIIAAAGALAAFASTAVAQQPGTPQPMPKSTTSSPTTSPSTQPAMKSPSASPSGAGEVGGSGTFSGWLSDYQTKNSGRVSRQAYMDEVGRRWDQMDTNKQGLTSDQINKAYGYGGASGTVNTTPGNMGPQNVKK